MKKRKVSWLLNPTIGRFLSSCSKKYYFRYLEKAYAYLMYPGKGICFSQKISWKKQLKTDFSEKNICGDPV
jgi:hypothetical protein